MREIKCTDKGCKLESGNKEVQMDLDTHQSLVGGGAISIANFGTEKPISLNHSQRKQKTPKRKKPVKAKNIVGGGGKKTNKKSKPKATAKGTKQKAKPKKAAKKGKGKGKK